jgi:hypothetical protein
MKDFRLIDWKKYNRPPYWQQWMCTGDTEKLAKFGDSNLTDVNQQILLLKDETDLDNGTGKALDRRGKVLVEPRNANPDKVYRKFLKLRTMLNTADGSLNNIIEIMKFAYESRSIRLIPEYPAALIVEYDGEAQSYFDYNTIMAQVIPAGVGYYTRARFIFIEDPIIMSERESIKIIADWPEHMKSLDAGFGMHSRLDFVDKQFARYTLVYGGAGVGIIYNSEYQHNAKLKYQTGGAQSRIYNSAYIHDGTMIYDKEKFRYLHNGEIVYGNGLSDLWAYDDFNVKENSKLSDLVESSDRATVKVKNDIQDQQWEYDHYDSLKLHDGSIAFKRPMEKTSFKAGLSLTDYTDPLTDSLDYDTTENEDGSDQVSMQEIGRMTAILDMSDSSEEPQEGMGNITQGVTLSDSLQGILDEIQVIQTGSWVYGEEAPFRYHHGGDIKFNSGVAVPV